PEMALVIESEIAVAEVTGEREVEQDQPAQAGRKDEARIADARAHRLPDRRRWVARMPARKPGDRERRAGPGQREDEAGGGPRPACAGTAERDVMAAGERPGDACQPRRAGPRRKRPGDADRGRRGAP